jgi:putative CocE/NonD family hydrolase
MSGATSDASGAGVDPGMITDHDVMVPMRDGIRLATDVHRPSVGGAFPVLLERTPYGKQRESLRERTAAHPRPMRRDEVAAYFVRRGYIVVVQDCRGRYASEGTFTKYLGEADDGADTMAWVRTQSWCNGRIGTFGLSYAAHTQTALVSRKPVGLGAMFLDCGGFSNAYRGGIRHGGAFELKQATWGYKQALLSPAAAASAVVRDALSRENIGDWFLSMPWKRGHSPLRWVPEYEDYLFEQWERGTFGDYWRQPELYAAGHYDSFDGIPVHLMCGWWDPYAQTTTDNYSGISRRSRSSVHMVLGPWTHGERSVSYAGDVDFGRDAILDGNVAADYLVMRGDWFDRWLKDEQNNIQDPPRVTYFRMGGGSGCRTSEGRLDHGGSWHHASDWPLPGTDFRMYYLHERGRLSECRPEGSGSLSYEFDPDNPVPTIGGPITSGEPLMFPGAFDQRTASEVFGARPPYLPLAARRDVLVFETEPLEDDVEITGPIEVRLWISSSAPDTDFTAKLIDWHPPTPDYPQGYAMNLTDGIIRCRYRKSWEHPCMLEPGEITEVVIDAMPTSNIFMRGHRIRLDVSSSNFPRFDVNHNTGDPEGRGQRRVVATNVVHVSSRYPSGLVLPVIPRRY